MDTTTTTTTTTTSDSNNDDGQQIPQPHAFHMNLPPHFMDKKDGIPFVTKFAARKAKQTVDLAFSIQIKESLFQYRPSAASAVEDDDVQQETGGGMDDEEEDDEMILDDDIDDEEEAPTVLPSEDADCETTTKQQQQPEYTLQSISKRCSRLISLLSSLENLKYCGISQSTWMDMVLHLLRLVTATITFDDNGNPTSHYDNVGTILHFGGEEEKETASLPPKSRVSLGDLEYKVSATTEKDLDEEMGQNFALPTPTREVLLLALINILSNKGPLRSVSNSSIYYSADDDETDPDTSNKTNKHHRTRSLLILQWKPLLRMLLRTAPYLDEHAMGKPVKDSNSRTSTVLKRTVQLIRDARHFFEQGVRPPGYFDDDDDDDMTLKDRTSKDIWDMVQADILFHSHTHACYRGTILLYLFQPSRCSEQYYKSVLPHWWNAWTNIDRCPEYDFLWLALFCRARKYVKDYDWSPIRKRLLTHSQYWLQLPIGGAAMDKSFPRAGNPRSRSCPPRLKVFAGAGSSYDEGIDFVAKVTKLLVAGLGTGDLVPGKEGPVVTEGTNDVLRFLSFVAPYFNPSNLGNWTFTLGAFLHYFAYELCCRMGSVAGNRALMITHPGLVQASQIVQPGSYCADIAAHEVVALMDALLPLCQQALYSKNGHVGRAGEAAMLYLVQIDPEHTTPAFIDFACRALDISAVNLSHQAPSALSALTRLVQPALRSDPCILLARLPELLRLSLAGIDSNDQNKSIRTLILYRNLASWVPVGGRPEKWTTAQVEDLTESKKVDGTLHLGTGLYTAVSGFRKTGEYLDAIDRLPDTSLLKQGTAEEEIDHDMQMLLLEEAISAMSDWALEFLERVFELLRASGEREKKSKRASGVASRHSSADVHQARNFSRVLKETLIQVFSSMDEDTHRLAIRKVTKFLLEETLPTAAKDASLLCQAAAAFRGTELGSPGLDAIVPLLTDELSMHSTKTVIYRLRCLAGGVRSAGKSVLARRDEISAAIEFALSSKDRHLFKTGCKLFRHTLSTLVESYPVPGDAMPRVFSGTSGSLCLGRSAQLHGDAVQWHTPDCDSINFALNLLNSHVVKRLDTLCSVIGTGNGAAQSKVLNSPEINDLRRCLRVIRYTIRGGASVLLDSTAKEAQEEEVIPYEKACLDTMNGVDEEAKGSLLSIRGRLCSFLVVLSSVIASETLYPEGIKELREDDPHRKILPLISSDPKVCKETSDISLLLLTRRGAAFRSQEARTIWKAQKQMAADFMLCSQVDQISETLQCAALYGDARTVLYKDGEDGGKTVPRRLLIARVKLFHDSLQRSASFEIPRRLRRLERESKGSRNMLFSVKTSLSDMIGNLESILVSSSPNPLDAYEGLADGLYALCCHSSTQVRASALSVIDYTMTRFGWLVAVRVPRLLSSLALKDEGLNGKFGIPSCCALVEHVNHNGKRKKLAEAVKGVCSILSLSRAMKHVQQSQKLRHLFAGTICGTDSLLALVPTEETQKLVHYLQAVFSQFRAKIYDHPCVSSSDILSHRAVLCLCLDILSEKTSEDMEEDSADTKAAVHWRKMLQAAWFLLTSLDKKDLSDSEGGIEERTWSTCFRILETEKGQPLQRVALGLFGRLIHLSGTGGSDMMLQDKIVTESFCRSLLDALVYDHRADTTVGGGHDAQWAAGVEEIIRDAARNVALRTLFPFQRTSQALGSFKASHAQLMELVLSTVSDSKADTAIQHLLKISKELAAAPPSEDQRNQQVTAAEVYAGVCGFFLRQKHAMHSVTWKESLLPHLEDVMGKIPFSLSGAYFDSLRFALQFSPPASYYPLTEWLVNRIRSTLWQPASGKDGENIGQQAVNGTSQGTDGFTAQSKWLYLFTAVLIEMDESEAGSSSRATCYKRFLAGDIEMGEDVEIDPELETSWKLVIESLLPRLTAALGHPFDSCRDHVSRCLFRICYCHRKKERVSASRTPSISNNLQELSSTNDDPGAIVVQKLATLAKNEGWSFKDRYNALSTAKRFIAYSVHLGEAKFEFSDYVIPLLPLAFEAIKSTVEDEITDTNANQEEDAARRALEADVIKGFRAAIAEVSVTAVISYGNERDISRVLEVAEKVSHHDKWQVRHAAMHFVRCFQGAHKFLFSAKQRSRTLEIVANVLADERREVSSAAMSALIGILAASPVDEVALMVKKYVSIANKSKMKRSKKGASKSKMESSLLADSEGRQAELRRSQNQKTSVFFLCAAVLARPYDTPPYVPVALASVSKHSFGNAPLGVRETVKKCCAEYKKTHMSENWEVHRRLFTQEQLEALEDVVSIPHYYA